MKEQSSFTTKPDMKLHYETAPEVVDQIKATFEAAIAKLELHYPEPYIAAASHMNSELHFLHILHYQFWLWYFFVFLVTFFFLSFLTSAKLSQPSVRPRRETRGVSRSKCGDLITAGVPLMWAASIIVSESTDATDVTDGFSTGEVIIGVRAYQWGWEYYYPRTRTLRHSEDLTYSSLVGNSVRYTSSSATSRSAEPLWRQFQAKIQTPIVTPAQLIAIPGLLANFKDFDVVGLDTSKQLGAFSKITAKTKTSNLNLSYSHKNYVTAYKNINDLLTLGEYDAESPIYGLKRQSSLTSLDSVISNASTFLDSAGKARFLESRSGPTNTASEFLSELTPVSTVLTGESLVRGTPDVVKTTKTPTPVSYLDQQLTLTGAPNKGSTPSSTSRLNAFNPSNPNSRSDDLSFLQSERAVRTQEFLNSNLLGAEDDVCERLPSYAGRGPEPRVLAPATDKFSTLSASNVGVKRATLGFPRPAFTSNNMHVRELDFDKTWLDYKTTSSSGPKTVTNSFTLENTDPIRVLQGDTSSSLAPIFGAYWRKFWANSGTKVRFSGIGRFVEDDSSFYLPNFTNYYDYDFRNAQAIELLEDSFWESCYSSYDHYDYIVMGENFKGSRNHSVSENEPEWVKVFDNFFHSANISDPANTSPDKVSGFDKTLGQFFSSSVEMCGGVNLPHTKTFKDQGTSTYLDSLTPADDSAESISGLRVNLGNTFKLNVAHSLPINFKVVLNSFRSDLSDPVQLRDTQSSTENLFTSTNVSYNNSSSQRVTNPLVLRSTARNSTVTFNALRKVFRSRFDEGRAHVSGDQFANLSTKQPFISSKPVNYRGMLSKNSDSYYTTPLYTSRPGSTIFGTSNLLTLQNFYFYDLPFLLSQGSDPQKFMWFDWWANWGVFEVQPSSVAKYSTLGVPYSKKHFDFSSDHSDTVQDSETYINRIVRLRKNYLPNWQYSPILFSKLVVWNDPTRAPTAYTADSDSFSQLKNTLYELNNYARSASNGSLAPKNFTPSISGNNVYSKKAWRPFSSIQSYYYDNAHLVDILTKREVLYRKYFGSRGKLVDLPKTILSTPQNPLVSEIKASFALVDPSTYSNEVSRDYFYATLPYFQYTFLKYAPNLFNSSELPVNTSVLSKYLLVYFFNLDSSDLGSNVTLYKDQHRPLKKGITNMLRLHSTGVFTVPAHTRLQVLASSRDVIHSWAIPSAGIKIDCVPGYTSHRIMTLNFEGIYWGQCQEICGRYHHWMPIVMYVLKRDIFILWCTHFVFTGQRLGDWKASGSRYVHYSKNVSYDKNAWLDEPGFASSN